MFPSFPANRPKPEAKSNRWQFALCFVFLHCLLLILNPTYPAGIISLHQPAYPLTSLHIPIHPHTHLYIPIHPCPCITPVMLLRADVFGDAAQKIPIPRPKTFQLGRILEFASRKYGTYTNSRVMSTAMLLDLQLGLRSPGGMPVGTTHCCALDCRKGLLQELILPLVS